MYSTGLKPCPEPGHRWCTPGGGRSVGDRVYFAWVYSRHWCLPWGPDVVLAKVSRARPTPVPLGSAAKTSIHWKSPPPPILDEEIAQHPVPLRRHEEGVLVQGLAVVLLHGPRGLADEGDVILESRHASRRTPPACPVRWPDESPPQSLLIEKKIGMVLANE